MNKILRLIAALLLALAGGCAADVRYTDGGRAFTLTLKRSGPAADVQSNTIAAVTAEKD